MNGSRHIFAALLAAALLPAGAAAAAPLAKLTDVRLVDSPANDGDSFIAQAGEKKLHLRLYFVDCPEIKVTNDVDAKRVREQAGYFGLTNAVHVVAVGQEAKAFVDARLAKPFTVYTAYADAMGRSPTKRYYAFIVTSEGKDLAGELVENGLARVVGTRRGGPDGASAEKVQQRLHDLETRAILNRVGAWKDSSPDEVVRMRAVQREEDDQLKDLRHQVAQAEKQTGLVDLNTASNRQLQALPGVGPVLATRIIAARPYREVKELRRVTGIGSALFEKIEPLCTVEKTAQ